MILTVYLLGKLLMASCTPHCQEECMCSGDLINCNKQSLLIIPAITDQVEKVDLSYNLISDFNNLSIQAEELDISHNRLKFIDYDLGKSGIKYLNLSGNPLKEVRLKSPLLRNLDLSWCDISQLQEHFLDTLPSLEIANISYNPLTKIASLNGNLKELYLQGCHLKNVDFTLPFLETLDLSFNRFMTFLKLKSNLKYLKASHCSFNDVDLSLPHLKTLIISYNRLYHMKLNYSELQELDISWNLVRTLDVKRLKDLVILDASHNMLHELQLPQTGIKYLNVSFNPLSRLEVYFGPLKVVDCSSCKLKYINLPHVYSLNLSRNGIEGFTGEATYIDLSYNLIDAYSGKAKVVDLRGNRLSLPKRVSVDGRAFFDNNPWLCKCEDAALRDLYSRSLDRVVCASPEGKTWESCFREQLPKYMKEYPWIPLVASGTLSILIVLSVFILRKRFWSEGIPLARNVHQAEPNNPRRIRLGEDLPSYEEALLMAKPRDASSSDILLNRVASSSSA